MPTWCYQLVPFLWNQWYICIYKWRKRQRQRGGRERAHAFVESARLKFVGQMYGQATQDGCSLALCTSLAYFTYIPVI